jgi:acetyl esterase
VTDLAEGMNSPSAHENANARPLNQAMLSWFYDHYLTPQADRRHPYVSPLHAQSHAGLPPATVILAGIDPLRSDGEAYAQKLREAGVMTDMHLFDGVTHEFFGMKGVLDEADEAISAAASGLRQAFEGARHRKAA